MIDPALIDKVKQWFGDPKGQCYVASEAIYYLSGGKSAGITPMQAKIVIDGKEVSHWWLRDEDYTMVDPTAEQFDFPFPYHLGRGRPFHPNMKSDTKELIEWIENADA